MNTSQDNTVIQKRHINCILAILDQHGQDFLNRTSQGYQKHSFENRYTLHPRQLDDLSNQDLEIITSFVKSSDPATGYRQGILRAELGLGHYSVLTFGIILRHFFLSHINGNDDPELLEGALNIVDAYMNAYLDGFIQTVEEQILTDQEQLRRALSTALGTQRRELTIKNHAIHTSINGILINDLKGRITYVNPALLKMWGYTDEKKLLSAKSSVLLGNQNINMDNSSPDRGGWQKELTAKRLDGSTFEVSISASTIRDENGVSIGTMMFFVDVSEQKKLEIKVKQSQKMNENILNSMNNMGDALVVIDLDGSIKKVNEAMCKLLDYSEEELLGKDMREIVEKQDPVFSTQGLKRLISNGTITNYETTYSKKDGNPIPMLFSGSVLSDDEGQAEGIVGIARDMTEHKQAEEMRKKETLLKEIHHRVKNNLQVISSLIYLQSRYVTDAKTEEMFKESQNRVRSIALIHEKLYRSNDLMEIDFSEYVWDLIKMIFGMYGITSNTVSLNIDIENIKLNMDLAIPCGLIINELVTNSLKHGFPQPNEHNAISVEFLPGIQDTENKKPRVNRRGYTLIISDNGIGFPDDIDFRNAQSLGLRLVDTLTRQLNGTIYLKRQHGTTFTLTFNES